MAQRKDTKLVIVGDSEVGKTALAERILGYKFKEKYIPTLGCDILPLYHKRRRYNLWDTSGSERFGGLREGYWINSDCVIIVVDKTTQKHRIHYYKQEIKKMCGDIPTLVVVNKTDMNFNETEDVDYQEFGNNLTFVSCKNGDGIQELINKI